MRLIVKQINISLARGVRGPMIARALGVVQHAEFPVIVTAGLAKQIAESLREQILSGQIKVAERLPTEEELARQFGVSRPTIREALKRLAAENLIQSRRGPRGGSTVKHPRPEEVSSL